MVHLAQQQAHDDASAKAPSSRATVLRADTASPPLPYVLIPDALILAFAHDPLAVGVYVAVTRLAMAAKNAIPLAARDLAAWMGRDRDAERAAVMRRITKLAEAGWLSIERSRSIKHRLLPTWGYDESGTARLWRFDVADSGKPAHVRGRRVPLALLDGYLGRLDPQPGHTRAVISRYLTRPLLDLTDVGVYTVGLRAEVTPTLRLQHLGLADRAGMRSPLTSEELLSQATRGHLTTRDSDAVVVVSPSALGFARLGAIHRADVCDTPPSDEHSSGSPSRSDGGSVSCIPGRSSAETQELGLPAQQYAGAPALLSPAPVIAWDVGNPHERTNHESSADTGAAGGGAAGALVDDQPDDHAAPDVPTDAPGAPMGGIAALLEHGVAAGHLALNPLRPIPPGEWYELLRLQQLHGAEQLLIWQARATRRANAHAFGIAPGYYRACAVRDTLPDERRRHDDPAPDLVPPAAVCSRHDISALDPACDALLRTMGVRERQQLAGVPYDVISAWQAVLNHPGMIARFRTPLGFAVSQMRLGNRPPSRDELECWATHAQRSTDRYESWRHLESQISDLETSTREVALEGRVRALAPPDADLATLCALARLLEDGVPDHEALARVGHTTHRGAP